MSWRQNVVGYCAATEIYTGLYLSLEHVPRSLILLHDTTHDICIRVPCTSYLVLVRCTRYDVHVYRTQVLHCTMYYVLVQVLRSAYYCYPRNSTHRQSTRTGERPSLFYLMKIDPSLSPGERFSLSLSLSISLSLYLRILAVRPIDRSIDRSNDASCITMQVTGMIKARSRQAHPASLAGSCTSCSWSAPGRPCSSQPAGRLRKPMPPQFLTADANITFAYNLMDVSISLQHLITGVTLIALPTSSRHAKKSRRWPGTHTGPLGTLIAMSRS